MHTPGHEQKNTAAEHRSNQFDLESLIRRIDDALPQTQCKQCGYDGCRPYAEAIAQGQADINQCPPGGAAGIERLASLLHRPYLALNPAHGIHKPKVVALIDEEKCIGCTLCIQACPVDAILGASKRMHTVISQACTGCELCLPPCPVDCISLPPAEGAPYMTSDAATLARQRHIQRQERLSREKAVQTESYAKQAPQPASAPSPCPPLPTEAIKQSALAAAMARVKAQKNN